VIKASSEAVNPSMPEVGLPKPSDSENEVQVLEQPPIPTVDPVPESDGSDDEVEVLEPPPIPVINLVTDSKDEVAPPSTPPLGEIALMDTSGDTKSEVETLREMESITLSREESRESNKVKGKRVVAWGKMRRTAKRTRVEMMVSPERTNKEPECSSYPHSRGMDYTMRTRRFYEAGLSPDRRH
jgi:hypothetical protein